MTRGFALNICNNSLLSAADSHGRVQQVQTQVDPGCCLCFPQQSMGPAEHWRNQFVWAHAALNSNGAVEVLVAESFSGMMDSVPRQEGQGEAGQSNGQVDERSVWHIQVSATLNLQHP